MIERWCFSAVCFLCLALFFCGCKQTGPRLVKVTGVITLDGQPVADAIIHFTPIDGGRGSYARSDETGRYALQFLPGQPGATPGIHRIFISTADESGGSETVPARYNRKTELTATVNPRDATIDFPLETP
jgi:hypothetical protein